MILLLNLWIYKYWEVYLMELPEWYIRISITVNMKCYIITYTRKLPWIHSIIDCEIYYHYRHTLKNSMKSNSEETRVILVGNKDVKINQPYDLYMQLYAFIWYFALYISLDSILVIIVQKPIFYSPIIYIFFRQSFFSPVFFFNVLSKKYI